MLYSFDKKSRKHYEIRERENGSRRCKGLIKREKTEDERD